MRKIVDRPPNVWQRDCYQLTCSGYSVGGRYTTSTAALDAAERYAEDPAIKNSVDPTIKVWAVERVTTERLIAEVKAEEGS